jgi:mono/diheme cytochrome c family protein
MMAKHVGWGLVLAVATASFAWGAPTAAQKEELQTVAALMTKAGALFKAKSFQECGEVVQQAQEKISQLAASRDKVILRQLEVHHKRLKSAHALLELEGVELPELLPLEPPEPSAAPDKPGKTKGEPEPAAAGASFVNHVAPILITRCGTCHVNQIKGQFSAANYGVLMKGAGTDGKVIFPGDAMGSRIVEVIESGDMPRGGQKVTAEELALLKKWINEGAKFDGTDPNAAITTFSSAPAMPAGPTVAPATGKETVSFSKEIASVLAQNCTGCHGTNRPRENFSLFTFASLLKGGDSGPAITPGNGAESLIVLKLRGTGGGQRMPAGGLPPLPDDVIAKIETWIDEGAKFDGTGADVSLADIGALAKAANSTHEELSADRAAAAAATWNTAMPGVKHDKQESANFLVLGTVGENTLQDLVQKAEASTPKIAAILGAPSDQPLVKGRLTVFTVSARYDFGEIGKVITRSPGVPGDIFSLWRYNGVDALGVVLVPKKSDGSAPETLIAQQVAAVAVASTGKNVPRWFADGAGRVVAARLAGGDARVREWDMAVPAVFASLPAHDAFLSPKYEPEAGSIAAYSYVRFLMNDTRRFTQLMEGLRQGGRFEEQFLAAYGATPNDVALAWHRKGPGKPPKPPRPTANRAAKSE